jgi:hypothetical protein
MTDYSEQGAVPVEDSVVADPPTVDEVLEPQRLEHPEQVASSALSTGRTDEEPATEEAGGDVVGWEPSGRPEIEGPNSA